MCVHACVRACVNKLDIFSCSDGSDYVSEQVDLMLLSEEMEVCFNVTILDDDAFEDDESFSIFLSTVDEDVPETIMEATITIRDDDSM